MGQEAPPELTALLNGADPAAREAAWADFVRRYTKLFLKAAAALGGSYDDRMDRYHHILEGLQGTEFHRLKAYRSDNRSSFAGWLLVVSRRLAVDCDRTRFGRGGRSQTAPEAERTEQQARRRLVELTGSDVDPAELPGSGTGPEGRLLAQELHAALRDALTGLGPADRLLLKLRFEDDLRMREIADVMHLPTVFHAYRRLHTVLGMVRQRLRVQGIDEANP